MKKNILFALALLITFHAIAQKKMLNAAQDALEKGELDKAWESIQTAKDNDETKSLPKTWFIMGKILQAVGKSTNPVYTAISDNPALEAYNYYQKALDIDPKKKYTNEINLVLPDLSNVALNEAIKYYDAKSYVKALELFDLILKIETNTIYSNKIDTAIIYYTGITALYAKNYDKAIEYLNKAALYNYGGGATYSNLRSAYIGKGDTIKAIAAMDTANKLFPNDLSVLVDMVNFYLTSGQAKEAFSYLNKAKEKDPKNVSFIFAEGTLYEKMLKPDSAIEAYKKAIQIDSNYFNAVYNLGVIYYNKAKDIYELASKENDNVKYAELMNNGDEEVKKSIPYLERAHKIDPKEKSTAETLKSLYFRLQMNDKLNQLKQEMGW